MVKCLEYSLHELILSGYELLYMRVVVGVVGLAVAGLTIAQIVPCVHHLRDF
jgi:mannitol-specific phosphotransferase system IIBC component